LPNNITDNANPEFIDKVVLEMRDTFFCAMISDVLDGLGHTKQALAPFMRPLDDALVMVGRARTMLYAMSMLGLDQMKTITLSRLG